MCITDERVLNLRILRPHLALVDGLPARRDRCPRSLAVKATGVTDQNLPSEMSAAKKAAARKKKSAR